MAIRVTRVPAKDVVKPRPAAKKARAASTEAEARPAGGAASRDLKKHIITTPLIKTATKRAREHSEPVVLGIWGESKALLDLLHYRGVYGGGSENRIATAKAGVEPSKLAMIASEMKWAQGDLIARLGLSQSTVKRKVTQHKMFDVDQSERLLGLSRLIGQVQHIVEDAGNPEGFDAPAWFGRWLEKPNPALGGVAPWKYLDTMEGQSVLASLLNKMWTGTYA